MLLSPPRGTYGFARAILLGAVLLVPWMVRNRRLRTAVWSVVLVAVLAGPAAHPFTDLDNHHVLAGYWLLALLLTGLASDPQHALARTARWLVGLVFAFATIWKLLVPDFVGGDFLTYLLATDTQITRVAGVADLMDPDIPAENRELITDLRHDPTTPLEPTTLEVPEPSATVGPWLAVGALLVEGGVALAFLLPLRGRWRVLRDVLLAAFLVSTYGLLPVFGFGGLLAVMGLAASDLKDRAAAILYLLLWASVGALAIAASRIGEVG